ncbi:hypothetical protein DXT99_24460 [Pontibacter diazotrophicus]|uniref:Putative collagen-binding domain-containing protein n=1 Tax=Pontibacter diazotrophicus TaxID=1400979 RepID=A0A3D8L222_9BACT|nr:hypothetical protein DXT99_24460 [Pontibacter diazotrophicus]
MPPPGGTAGCLIGKYRNRNLRQFTAPGKAGTGNDWVLVEDDASQAFTRLGIITYHKYD